MCCGFSGVECKDEIYSCSQLEHSCLKREVVVKKEVAKPLTGEQFVRQVFPPRPTESVTAKLLKSSPGPKAVTSQLFTRVSTAVQPRSSPQPTSVTSKLFSNAEPQPATSKIFVPRTEDMNKGFLTFSDDESGLTSKLTLFLN